MLILAQVDDCSGEELGEALERLAELGARNLQLLSSLTKKGRPGYVLLLDVEPPAEAEVAAFLAAELGVWGYHRLEAEHRHFTVEPVSREVHLTCGSRSAEFAVRCKLFWQQQRLLRVKADLDDMGQVMTFIGEAGGDYPLSLVRAAIEREVWCAPFEERLLLHF